MIKSSNKNFKDNDTDIDATELNKIQTNTITNCTLYIPVTYFRRRFAVFAVFLDTPDF
jgi:hypothetical protein